MERYASDPDMHRERASRPKTEGLQHIPFLPWFWLVQVMLFALGRQKIFVNFWVKAPEFIPNPKNLNPLCH
jgi:hypothetical protein